jgi:hypothetical protein
MLPAQWQRLQSQGRHSHNKEKSKKLPPSRGVPEEETNCDESGNRR